MGVKLGLDEVLKAAKEYDSLTQLLYVSLSLNKRMAEQLVACGQLSLECRETLLQIQQTYNDLVEGDKVTGKYRIIDDEDRFADHVFDSEDEAQEFLGRFLSSFHGEPFTGKEFQIRKDS